MIVRVDKSFDKDTDKIRDKDILLSIAYCIEGIQKAESLKEIKNLKKLKGSNFFYRIRIGEYRIGLEIIDSKVEFIRFLHRKDIYKSFPK
jgi:mRNA interferase RelE/StbE